MIVGLSEFNVDFYKEIFGEKFGLVCRYMFGMWVYFFIWVVVILII